VALQAWRSVVREARFPFGIALIADRDSPQHPRLTTGTAIPSGIGPDEPASARAARAYLGQPSLGALQLTLELLQAGARADSPPVVLCTHKGDSIVEVKRLRTRKLEFAGTAHALVTTVC
jgi:hypothetical protein